MGASCDWTREKYTLDSDVSRTVRHVFKKMFEDNLIYRGHRIVNWCPRCSSTISDDEVKYDERKEKLYWIKYGPFVLATARPETKLGDTAVAVHPSDKRYKHMVGKKYLIPGVLGEFEVIVVADEAVDPEFGTGAVKVTPAHSFTDFEIAQRHKIAVKQVINEEGKMMSNCGKYAGMTTKECRKELVKDMEKMGLIEKIEDYDHSLSLCYRCDAVIEPLVSEQWFIDVNKAVIKEGNKKVTIKDKSISVVKDGEINIVPDRFNKTYFHWMENLRDWCISRQIWWGHRIPVWYCKKDKGGCGAMMVEVDTPKKCDKCGNEKLKQDPDTLDTWFSSGLWTFSTLGWPDKKDDFEYFHSTDVLETGYDILFFWIARMIIMTTYCTGEVPFKNVYLHGLVRDKDGRKMSKSLDNGIDPLDMIKKFGADAVRLSLIVGSTPGNDLRLYEEKIAGFRNFVNKIWNAGRFALMNLSEEEKMLQLTPSDIKSLADKWILTRLNQVIEESTREIENYRLSDAAMKIYDFFWGEYCDWYLEISKGEHKNPAVLVYVLKNIYKLLHPFVPYVTEVSWSYLDKKNLLITEEWPLVNEEFNFAEESNDMQMVIEVIKGIRSLRAESKVEAAKKISAVIFGEKHEILEKKRSVIESLARLDNLEISEEGKKPSKSVSAVVGSTEIHLPLEGLIDFGKEKARLQKEIDNVQGYITGLKKKLDNKKFASNAPKDVVDQEKKKLDEAEKTVKNLRNQITNI